MPTGEASSIPAAEFEITDELVRDLLRSQHPDLAPLPFRAVANGFDNVIYRLGDDLAIRLPRRAVGAVLVEHEQRWLPVLAPRLPLAVPVPVRVGRPEFGYPWVWSITPWFEGEVAADVEPADPSREAERLGAFMAALHEPAPADAPANPFRDGFVGEMGERFGANVDRMAAVLDRLAPRGAMLARDRWRALVAAGPFAGPATWVSGDVHSGNLVVAQGEIRAVIDFGDLCAGDPAVDLAIAWMLFDEADRRVFRDAASQGSVPVDDPMWQRAEAWAWHFALLYLANSADDERLARMGRRLAATLLDAAV